MRRYQISNQENRAKKTEINQKKLSKDIYVDVNILLNRVKMNEKNKKKENLIILFSVIFLISVTGIFTIF
tara:strand:+ start:509 stop:718 length:210 start_codon:yes stop_codon:yes gene_type:complete